MEIKTNMIGVYSPGLGIVFWIISTWVIGYIGGEKLDTQCRDREGKPKFIQIPKRFKWLFNFHYPADDNIVWGAALYEISMHIVVLIDFSLLIIGAIWKCMGSALAVADGLFWLWFWFGIVVTMLVDIPYQRNLRRHFAYDRITAIQEAFGMRPRRRCKVVGQIDENTYEISMGFIFKHRYHARTIIPVKVGDKVHAVHYYDKGHPYWTIKPY